MKKNSLLILVMLFVTSFVYGQLKVVLFNTGVLSVKGSEDNPIILYIKGDLVTDNRPATSGCNIKVGGGKIVLTGDLRHNAYSDLSRNGYTNVFSRDLPANGKLEFRGNTKQEIYSDSIRSISTPFVRRPKKNKDYILFPDIVEVNNIHTVVMDPCIAGEMKDAEMTKGVFVLDSKLPDTRDYPISAIPVNPSLSYNTMIAHLKVTGSVAYPCYEKSPSMIADYDEIGRFQVNILVNPADGSDNLTSSYGAPYKRMYGMTSPYEAIRSDYFMFNTLTLPDPDGFLGINHQTERSPEVALVAGRGFFAGIDLRGTDEDNYKHLIDEKYFQIRFDSRAVHKYLFNRFKYTGNINNLYSPYNENNMQIYRAEKLVTGNIRFSLQKGYNYLGNSFSAPLSVRDLLEETGGNLAGEWNVRVGDNAATNRQLMNRIWLANPNTRAYESGNSIYYYHTYYTVKTEGGTYTGDISAEDEFLVPPFQLFRVYSYSNMPVEITIPKNNVTHGSASFLRSAPQNDMIRKERYDDFVFEVIDSISGTSDRVCVVIRESEIQKSSSADLTEDDKLSFKTETVQIAENGNLKLRSNSLPDQSAMSILYLKTGKGNAVDEKRLPLTVRYEDLYMTPSWIPQIIYLRGLRLNTMKNVQKIWLEDKKKGTKTLMTPDTYYKTTSEPTDSDDRFRLWFSEEETGLTALSIDKNLNVFYDRTSETLIARKFEESDFGSIISVYDLQGKLYLQEKVNKPVMNINRYLPNGLYIIRVSGSKNIYATKVLVK